MLALVKLSYMLEGLSILRYSLARAVTMRQVQIISRKDFDALKHHCILRDYTLGT